MERESDDRSGVPRAAREPLRDIVFDVRKYGRYLLADAGRTDALPGFITSPQRHRLAFYDIARDVGSTPAIRAYLDAGGKVVLTGRTRSRT